MPIKRKTTIRYHFGTAVKKRRQELNISQEELAARAALHRTYISDIERGARNVSLENIEKIARALSIKISDLFVNYEINKKP